MEIVTNSIGMKLVWILAGEFMMGYDNPFSFYNRDSYEKPVHKVKLTKGFWMGVHEVTQSQYQAVMGNNPSCFKGDNNPVEQVSWDDAVEFCKKLSKKEGKTYTLPTEAQWEYACRAGSTTEYSFGDSESSLGDYAWHEGNSGGKTHPVGTKKANKFGLYDMYGNVSEWCLDWSWGYPEGTSIDPEGPKSGTGLILRERVLRGGSWLYADPMYCGSAMRYCGPPGNGDSSCGFRVVALNIRS
jgi:formylglycine-generating enzyme required for sulfatase activity